VILYCAGNDDQNERLFVEGGLRHRLLTFASVDECAGAFGIWAEAGVAGGRLFMDSGAFGAHTRGVKIDLARYCEWLLAHQRTVTAYAALDVIKDWRGTQANLDEMIRRDTRPVPTFHRGSPLHVLDGLAKDHEYIALGGVVSDRSGPEALRVFFDECWDRIGRHWPRKVHAFGVQAQWALERYPFYSADSSTAIVGGGMGRVSRFTRGRFGSRPWREDLPDTWDGVIADGLAGRNEDGAGSAHAGRKMRSVDAIVALERHVTEVWSARGVAWDAAGAYTGKVAAA
jgi:hypothetical protein